jgi:hypothetical protein
MGRVQRACLAVIDRYEADGKLPTTYNISADVYEVAPDAEGNRLVSDAQHVAVKRALENLRRKGHIVGFRTQRTRDPGYDHRTELCHHWMTPGRFAKWQEDEAEARREIALLLQRHHH